MGSPLREGRLAVGPHRDVRELDVQYLLGDSTPDMVRRYSATYNSEKVARAHEAFSPADSLGQRPADLKGTTQ